MYASFVARDDLIDPIAAESYSPQLLKISRRTAKFKRLVSSLTQDPRLGVTGTIEKDYVEADYPGAVPYLTTKQVNDVLAQPTDCKFITAAADRKWASCRVPDGAILINKSGRVGSAALLRAAPYKYVNTVSDLINIRVDPNAIDPYFLVVFLNTEWSLGQLWRRTGGSVVDHVSIYAVPEVRVPNPAPAIQRAIGNKVRKAERLRELAADEWRNAHALLEAALGQPLEPKAFEVPNADHLSRAGYRCTSLRPAMAVVSVDDEIGAQYFHPRREHARQIASRTGSWQRLDQLARRVRKKGRGMGFLGLDLIDSSTGVVTAASNNASAEGALFERDDILFSRLRPYLNKVTICTEQCSGVGSTELLVYRPKDGIDPYYLFLVLKCPLGLYQVIDVTSGSTHPRVDEEVVDGIRVPRIGADKENEIGDNVRAAFAHWTSAPGLVDDARTAVESLIDGTLDEAALLAEGEAIEQWLAENPSPHETEKP